MSIPVSNFRVSGVCHRHKKMNVYGELNRCAKRVKIFDHTPTGFEGHTCVLVLAPITVQEDG